ncbi:response regulator [Bacillus shivajii]|uniref:response regulator n=1 Tax=Bacillus shivajii TaxID=1983719 RepID=UPI001CFBC89F|nr:response regulator [Bacillus shivajii]UCZ54173.1 response regulator [Bacillus shivajii]
MQGELSVLVCDDSEIIRKQFIDSLKTIGINNIYEAKDGKEAVIACLKKKPDIVFLDIIMPNMDGIAALKEIHQLHPQTKVIMASSTTGQAHLKKSRLLGAYSFIQKPISESVIRDIIEKVLHENESASL